LKTILSVIGLLLVLEGLPYAAFPEKMLDWLRQLIAMPPALLRIMGFMTVAVGLFLCYLARRTGFFG